MRDCLIATLAFGLLAACTSTPPPCTRVGGVAMLEYQLFFGRDIPGRPPLTDAEWADFTARVITPNLPDGFTAFDAAGQWMNPATHRIAHDPTKVLIVAVPDSAATTAAITAIRQAYQSEFHQQLVGMMAHPVCGAF